MGEDGFMAEMGGKVGFMFNWKTLGYFMRFKDSEGRPLFLHDIRNGRALYVVWLPLLHQLPHAGLGAGNKALAFGNWSYYNIRRISSMRFRVFDELYGLRDQIAGRRI